VCCIPLHPFQPKINFMDQIGLSHTCFSKSERLPTSRDMKSHILNFTHSGCRRTNDAGKGESDEPISGSVAFSQLNREPAPKIDISRHRYLAGQVNTTAGHRFKASIRLSEFRTRSKKESTAVYSLGTSISTC
jgi:hypothetical protein